MKPVLIIKFDKDNVKVDFDEDQIKNTKDVVNFVGILEVLKSEALKNLTEED